MAVTKIKPIKSTLSKALDYIENPDKTDGKMLVSSFGCSYETADIEFEYTLSQALQKGNNLAFHLIQSFEPGEVDYQKAHEIGKQLADAVTKGQHEYVLTTHIDKGHVHNHIIFCAVNFVDHRKYNSNKRSYYGIRNMSDKLCRENGLSVVVPGKGSKGKSYAEYQAEKTGTSWKGKLKIAVDALIPQVSSFEELLQRLQAAGYEIKPGKYVSCRAHGQERFTRLRASTLGDGYDLQDVLSAIEGKEKRPGRSERKISLAVDIQAKLAAGKGPGYERWAKVFNIKQMAAALAYIQDNNLTDYEQLAKKATEAADRFHVISEQVKQTEQAMKTNAGLKAATVQYAKTRPVFEQYKATKYSRKFLAEHEADLELYRAAQAEMRSLLGGAKLPKMDVLKEEGRKLTAKKKQLYGEYQKARRDMQEIVTIKANIDTLMGYTEPGRKQEKER